MIINYPIPSGRFAQLPHGYIIGHYFNAFIVSQRVVTLLQQLLL